MMEENQSSSASSEKEPTEEEVMRFLREIIAIENKAIYDGEGGSQWRVETIRKKLEEFLS